MLDEELQELKTNGNVKTKTSTKIKKSMRKSKRISVDPTGFHVSEVDHHSKEDDDPEEVNHRIDAAWMAPRDHSVFEFRDISYIVGKRKKQKQILTNVSGRVSDGSTVAILGPSGAGKTSLLKALSLGITSGEVMGSIELNGKKLTSQGFKDHCFLVEQSDHHWSFLSCQETLMYAASLLLGPGNHSAVVENVIDKMGLQSCKDTKVGNDFVQGLSGGQKRRLSIAIALLKKPAVIMLDEPTSGLDSAASVAIVSELRKLAKSENLIVIMTIHQPSTKVYNDFDQVMLMSKGRQAYMGKAASAHEYFETIGYPMMQMTNPADFLVDLVNADFTSEDSVIAILDEWKRHLAYKTKRCKGRKVEVDSNDDFHQLMRRKKSFLHQLSTVFRRHGLLVARDPILYVGRIVVLLISNTVFSLAYWSSRDKVQEQSINFYYANAWPISLGSMFAVVAVFVLNSEFKSIMREVRNGMINPVTYIMAKTILVLPVMLLFGAAALSTGVYAILGLKANYGVYMVMYAISVFVFECIAEVLSVAFINPLMGMLCFLSIWFTSFLFGGTFLPPDDLSVVIRWLYHAMPLSYTFNAISYHVFAGEEWPSCIPDANAGAVCVDFNEFPREEPITLILESLSKIVPNVSGDDNRMDAMAIILGMALGYKFLYVAIFLFRTSQSTKLRGVCEDTFINRDDVQST
ncbi:unnamed protein product [Cylindrotheca closterium]|uniref:ABC transporter domain-containing protein n=1 Tax=Cylindrotheca closterium TaxID=2856 RepID=A0AAD2CWN2_9STRA|nr:unnamed protein product [Cylindrotheca closterium]